MIILLTVMTTFFHLILPFIFFRWVAYNKGDNKIYRISVAVVVGCFFIIMWVGGAGWYWFGRWWPVFFFILYGLSLIKFFMDLKEVPWLPPKKTKPLMATVLLLFWALISIGGPLEIPSYRNYQGEALKLSWPFKKGEYAVVHGGASVSVNHHFEIDAQKFALDIVKLNSWGVRAKGIYPKTLSDYESWEKSSMPLVLVKFYPRHPNWRIKSLQRLMKKTFWEIT